MHFITQPTLPRLNLALPPTPPPSPGEQHTSPSTTPCPRLIPHYTPPADVTYRQSHDDRTSLRVEHQHQKRDGYIREKGGNTGNERGAQASGRVLNCVRGSPNTSSSSRVVRKYRRARLQRLRRMECKRLKEAVPSVQHQHHASEVIVIEEAVKYIQDLHNTLGDKLEKLGGGSEDLQELVLMNLRRAMLASMVEDENSAEGMYHGGCVLEKRQARPSYATHAWPHPKGMK